MSYTNTYLYGYLIKSFYLSAKQSDVILVVNGQRLSAHRFVLSSKSIIFRKMFFGPFRESNDKEIVLNNTNLEAFKLLLKYCYYEDLSPKDWSTDDYRLVIEVYKCAHFYQIRYLCLISEIKLIGLISVDNAIDVFEFGSLYRSKRIVAFLKIFAKNHGKELIGSKKLLKSKSKDTIKFFMKAIRLNKTLDALKTLIAIIDRNDGWTLNEFYDCIRFEDLTIDDMEYIRNNAFKYFPEISIKAIIKLNEKNSDLTEENRRLSAQLKAFKRENETVLDIGYGIGFLMEWDNDSEDSPSFDDGWDDWDGRQ